tara:strand:+ start:3252 stop:6110 length:2859 start_codon:yes stop_codon:yes gene_type:complete
MIQVQLFINTNKIDQVTGQVVDNWMQADLNDKAALVIKDTIKKAKDVGKVFTAHTNPFDMPASKNNNLIFKRFSSNKVYEGFDPRRKYSAKIKLNGVDYKKGYIKLNKVKMENNSPVAYSTQFFGELASVKDILSTNKLKDLLGLSKYSFDYTDETVHLGLESGFDVVVADSTGVHQVTELTINGSIPVGDTAGNLVLNGITHVITTVEAPIKYMILNQIANFINDNIATHTSTFAGIFSQKILITSNSPDLESDTTYTATSNNLDLVPVTETAGTTVAGVNTVIENAEGMIKFPLISHTRGFEYSDGLGGAGFHRMLADEENLTGGDPYVVVDNDRLNRFDVKPALKLTYIFDAIEETYKDSTPPLKFNRDWMFGNSDLNIDKSPMKDMYMWLHNKKGYMGYTTEEGDSTKYTVNRISKTVGSVELPEFESNFVTGSLDPRSQYSSISGSVSTIRSFRWKIRIGQIVGDGDFEIRTVVRDFYDPSAAVPLKENTQTFSASEAVDGYIDFELGYPFNNYNELVDQYGTLTTEKYYPEFRVIADTSIGEFKVNLEIYRDSFNTLGQNTSRSWGYISTPLLIPIPNLDISELMPDYKQIDFLSDLFKMYNLVAYENQLDDDSYEIVIESYDHFMRTGRDYDITKYIDIAKSDIERISPFAAVNYSFSEPKTFLAINQKELTGDSWGNVEFNVKNFSEEGSSTNSLLFDGGEYKVDLKLEKLMTERMSTTVNKDLTSIQWGWFVNDSRTNIPEPVLGKPLYMFCVNRVIEDYHIQWNDRHESDMCNAPSNVNAEGTQTLHFNDEYDEYTRYQNPNSLFNNYHSNYIQNIYSAFAKKINISAYLPPMMFITLRLNDTLIIDNISYFIDTMKVNVTTGKTDFSLLRVTNNDKRLVGGSLQENGADNLVWNTEDENIEYSTKDFGEGLPDVDEEDFNKRVMDDGGNTESLDCYTKIKK